MEIYGSRMLEVTCNFVADAENAVPGVDANGMMYHLPTSSQVEELVVYDSLNRSYRLAEPIAFLTIDGRKTHHFSQDDASYSFPRRHFQRLLRISRSPM